MRKKILQPLLVKNSATTQSWLDLAKLAQVQVSSELETNPVELAFTDDAEHKPTPGNGWLAAQPGVQTLRLLFDHPQTIHLIHLLFHETQQARTQEFSLGYSTAKGASYQQILRQQYTFSPPATCTQEENYRVQLECVTALELTIMPDISGGKATASLASLKLA